MCWYLLGGKDYHLGEERWGSNGRQPYAVVVRNQFLQQIRFTPMDSRIAPIGRYWDEGKKLDGALRFNYSWLIFGVLTKRPSLSWFEVKLCVYWTTIRQSHMEWSLLFDFANSCAEERWCNKTITQQAKISSVWWHNVGTVQRRSSLFNLWRDSLSLDWVGTCNSSSLSTSRGSAEDSKLKLRCCLVLRLHHGTCPFLH